VDDMEIISTSKPSFANAPVSLAIHMDAIVPEVKRKAIRNGREAAAWQMEGAALKVAQRSRVTAIRAERLTAMDPL
jgi:hypothetical protein